MTGFPQRGDCAPPLPGAEEGGTQFPQPRHFSGRFSCLPANGIAARWKLAAARLTDEGETRFCSYPTFHAPPILSFSALPEKDKNAPRPVVVASCASIRPDRKRQGSVASLLLLSHDEPLRWVHHGAPEKGAPKRIAYALSLYPPSAEGTPPGFALRRLQQRRATGFCSALTSTNL